MRRTPCEVCRRLHRGPRCTSRLGIQLNVHLPPHVHRALTERVPWGERSGWIARVVAKELDA